MIELIFAAVVSNTCMLKPVIPNRLHSCETRTYGLEDPKIGPTKFGTNPNRAPDKTPDKTPDAPDKTPDSPDKPDETPTTPETGGCVASGGGGNCGVGKGLGGGNGTSNEGRGKGPKNK